MVLKAAGRIEELRGCLSGQVGWLVGAGGGVSWGGGGGCNVQVGISICAS